MGFTIVCNNKGCGKTQQPLLDAGSNEVFCSECDKTISNVNSFTKNQMKSIGQIKRSSKQSFSFKCNKCKKEGTPKLLDDKFVCAYCSSILENISKHFEKILRDFISKPDSI